MKDLHLLPRVRDSLSFLYVEHCKIDQEAKSIAVHDARGKTPVPCAALSLLMLGPGTTITHAAVGALAANGCLVIWSGEEGVRLYAQGMGETRSARNLLRQAWLCSEPTRRLEVVMRMYRMRFAGPLDADLTLQQIRGKEGVRVRDGYARASRDSGVPWAGRSYRRDNWNSSDPVNRALSAANSCLYGIAHAAIVAAGYSTALGFVHTGKQLSFVYDIADLYKLDITVPIAFRAAAEGAEGIEGRVRRACRDAFHRDRLLQRILPDIDQVLGARDAGDDAEDPFASDDALPGGLWDPFAGEVEGGINMASAAE
jgi:CRISPR-associated protein Cas1